MSPMIRHWCEILGDQNPVYTDAGAAAASRHGGLVARRCAPGLDHAGGRAGAQRRAARPDRQQAAPRAAAPAHGYTSVVATNCGRSRTTAYLPDRRTGDVHHRDRGHLAGEGHGFRIGHFIDMRNDTSATPAVEPVAWMTFRVLKFKPAQTAQAAALRRRPRRSPRRLRPRSRPRQRLVVGKGIERGDCGSSGVRRIAARLTPAAAHVRKVSIDPLGLGRSQRAGCRTARTW